MSLVRIRDKAQITLPRQVMRDHNLRAGDVVDVEVVGKTLRLTPKAAVDRAILLGRADYQAGRYEEFSSAAEMIAHLHKGESKKESEPHRYGRRR